MLTITVLGEESFDNETQEFTYPESFELRLEHSLVSLSKWEQFYEKPYLGKDVKTDEETLGYIYAMILDDVPREVVYQLSNENIQQIDDYINRKMTATWFTEVGAESRSNSETITAELIYYWMSQASIPYEAREWHLNQLFTLLKVHVAKNSKPKKMSRDEIRAQNREINARRRAQMGTSG